MSDQDPTHGDDATRDDATPTQPSPTEPAPSPDSIRTRAPSSYPDTRFEHGASTPLQGSTDTYATAHPGATPTVDREVPLDAFPGHELLEKLGEGAMGIVYKARQTGLNRLVAFEMILGGHRAGPKDLIRFLVEAEAVASIKHPHVVQIHEYGEADNRTFLAPFPLCMCWRRLLNAASLELFLRLVSRFSRSRESFLRYCLISL
jgi:serine/threonine protein kinase